MPNFQPIAIGGKKKNLDILYQKIGHILVTGKLISPSITQPSTWEGPLN